MVRRASAAFKQLSEHATEGDALADSEKSTPAVDRGLVDIAAQIHDLKHSIRLLRIQQNLVQKRLDSYTYPVLTLPNEITSEIFLHFLPVYPLAAPLAGLLSPTLLTHVCRHWRDIAHAMPALWRAISMTFTESSDYEPFNNLLHPWMNRSRFYPISLFIKGGVDYDDPAQCMETLASHRARWEYLELARADSDILRFLCDPMPSLRHLDMSFGEYHSRITLGAAPLLRSVKAITSPDTAIILPWSQLTSLVLLSIYPSQATAILQQTTSIVHCEISFVCFGPVQKPDVELPFLQSFILIDEDDIQPPFLYSLILPALRTLEISHLDLGTPPFDVLRAFISKSGCTLRDLRIIGEAPIWGTNAYRTTFPTIPKISFHPFGKEQPGLVSGR
ncbi:hypothetical protein C8R43DRAFT_951612 [Mycena crocata]|nr:hypothetical protein C8R43DRAFT_951612 [Mycena crocata]